jgi:hypothetical protein
MLALAGATPLRAADLDDGPRAGYEPYAPYYYQNEPRPAPRRYVEPYRSERYDDERYYGDRDVYRYDRPQRYSRHDGRGCLPRQEILRRLHENGWRDLHDAQPRGDVAAVTARRPDGLVYRLRVDRCSGVIVSARLVDHGQRWQSYRRYSQRPY